MESNLVELLDYRDVLAAVASTRDGLVLSSVGLNEEDAESVAAAGTALAAAAAESGDSALAIDIEDGSLYLALGHDVMLVVLAETSVAAEPLATVMFDRVRDLDTSLNGGAFPG